jgi:hypothetical protein
MEREPPALQNSLDGVPQKTDDFRGVRDVLKFDDGFFVRAHASGRCL